MTSGTTAWTHRIGEELGLSKWLEITQEMVDAFADATGDHNPLHVDPEIARQSPVGQTIAHGFFTLSLAGGFLGEAVPLEQFKWVFNSGFDRIRFVSPLKVGEKVRLRALLKDVGEEKGATKLVLALTFETPSGAKPVCVADWILRGYADDPA